MVSVSGATFAVGVEARAAEVYPASFPVTVTVMFLPSAVGGGDHVRPVAPDITGVAVVLSRRNEPRLSDS